MCFIGKNVYATRKEARKAAVTPMIAKEEFCVYKRINRDGSPPVRSWIDFKYSKGFRHNEELKICAKGDGRSGAWYIEGTRGLHAHVTRKAAVEYLSKGQEIVKMYIPKGAKYHLGKYNQIITTDLIWY